jgi:hypothetical protein
VALERLHGASAAFRPTAPPSCRPVPDLPPRGSTHADDARHGLSARRAGHRAEPGAVRRPKGVGRAFGRGRRAAPQHGKAHCRTQSGPGPRLDVPVWPLRPLRLPRGAAGQALPAAPPPYGPSGPASAGLQHACIPPQRPPLPPVQVLSAEINMGYEELCNTQVGQGVAGRGGAACWGGPASRGRRACRALVMLTGSRRAVGAWPFPPRRAGFRSPCCPAPQVTAVNGSKVWAAGHSPRASPQRGCGLPRAGAWLQPLPSRPLAPIDCGLLDSGVLGMLPCAGALTAVPRVTGSGLARRCATWRS